MAEKSVGETFFDFMGNALDATVDLGTVYGNAWVTDKFDLKANNETDNNTPMVAPKVNENGTAIAAGTPVTNATGLKLFGHEVTKTEAIVGGVLLILFMGGFLRPKS